MRKTIKWTCNFYWQHSKLFSSPGRTLYLHIYICLHHKKYLYIKWQIQILRISHMTYQHITDFLSVSSTSSGTSGFGPSGSGMTWQALKSSKDEDIESCREGSKYGCTYPKILDIFIGVVFHWWTWYPGYTYIYIDIYTSMSCHSRRNAYYHDKYL